MMCKQRLDIVAFSYAQMLQLNTVIKSDVRIIHAEEFQCTFMMILRLVFHSMCIDDDAVGVAAMFFQMLKQNRCRNFVWEKNFNIFDYLRGYPFNWLR